MKYNGVICKEIMFMKFENNKKQEYIVSEMFFMRILLLMNFLFIDCDLNLYSLSFVVFVFNVICLLVFINY